MASVKNLKKEINYILGELIDVVTIWEITSGANETAESQQIIKDIITSYDTYLAKINDTKEAKKVGYFKSLRKDFYKEVDVLVEKINGLK